MKPNYFLSFFLFAALVQSRNSFQKQSSRATVSVLDVKMGHTLFCVLSLFLLDSLTHGQYEVSNKVTVTLQPNWSQIYRGEKITLRCQIHGAGDTKWTYEWRTTSLYKPSSRIEYIINSADEYHSGDYSCRGRSDYYYTYWSDSIRLTVSGYKPTPTLTPSNTVIPAGGRVTLTCSVDDSADWKYDWFRRDSFYSTTRPVTNVDPDRDIRVSEGGLYHCRGRRGEPEFFTDDSREVTVEETVPGQVSVTVQPSWSQIFSGETITVTCQISGGEQTTWTYEWKPAELNRPAASKQVTINKATVSNSGDYSCRGKTNWFFSTKWSNVVGVTVSSTKPQASLTADRTVIPAGGSVTLTCSVQEGDGWKYYWFRQTSWSSGPGGHSTRVSEGGIYQCRGGRGNPVFFTENSNQVIIEKRVSNKAVVTEQPRWSPLFNEETITLRCEIQRSGDTEWEYDWTTTSSENLPQHDQYWIFRASASSRGNYRCKGKHKHDLYSSTEWSDPITLTVSDKPRPVLTVSPSWLSPGASVTLKCEVEHPSAGWSFYWYKTVPQRSHNYYDYELLPGSTNGTEQDSYIIHGQTHTAGYVCRAGRGDPVYHTDYSEPKFVWSGDSHSAASLTVSPDSVQHFTYKNVSLSCEGNFTEWRVMRFPEDRYRHCSDWRRTTGSRCDIYTYRENSSVYWCESGSGEFSNAVNITTQDDYHHGIILVSPVHPVTEGQSVSLGCKFRTKTNISSAFFYHNDKLIQNETWREMNISAVSKSHEGFYKCQCSGKESQQSWMSVKVVEPRRKSLKLLIVGLVCGILLIILLLLLYRYSRSKDSCFIRLIQSERTSQDSSTSHMTNQNEPQQRCDYTSVATADVHLYDTIRDHEDTEHDAGEFEDVTYSVIEFKNIRLDGKSSRAATDDPLYSVVKPDTVFGNNAAM